MTRTQTADAPVVDILERRLEELRERIRLARSFDGGRVRGLRKLAGLSQKELAAIVGCQSAQISQWENGRAVPGGGACRSSRTRAHRDRGGNR